MQTALDRSLNERYIDLKVLAMRSEVRTGQNPARMREIFDALQKIVPNYAWIGFAKPDGTVLAATGALLEGQSVAQKNWFQSGLKNFVITDFHPATLLERKLPAHDDPWRFVDLAIPVTTSEGELKGVLGIHLSWSWARELARKLINPASDRYDVEILVVRADGVVLLGPKQLEEKKISTDSFRASLQQASGALSERGEDGRIYLTGFSRTGMNGDNSDLKWTVLVRQPEQVAMASFKELQRQIFLIGSLLALVLGALAYYTTRHLAQALRNLTMALDRRLAGEPDVSMPSLSVSQEIDELGSTLITLVEREQEDLHQLKLQNEVLEQRIAERTARLHETTIALQQALDSQRENQLKLADGENELRAILQNAHDAFIAIDEDGKVEEWNRQAEKLLGWRADEALGQDLAEMIVPPHQREAHRRGMRYFLATGKSDVINQRLEMHALRRDGRELPVEVTIGSVQRRNGQLFIAFLHDITDRLAFRNSLQQMALTDTLTGLPNRRAFTQKLPDAMARATRGQQQMGLLFMDIDGFKSVNDQYGHQAGDELLVQFSERLVEAVREVDLAARLGGDEFTVILERLQSPADAVTVAEKILHAMRQPFVLEAATVHMSSSIGVAIYQPGQEISQDALLALADKAMYAAKNAGKNQVVCSMEEKST